VTSVERPHAALAVKARGYAGETQALLLTGWPTHVLVMRNAETDSHGWSRLECLLTEVLSPPPDTVMLRFDDTSDPSDDRAPTDADVEQIVDLARSLREDDRLLVLCAGGYGRSTSAGLICRAVGGAEPAAALAETIADRPQATPNRLMIARADAVLGLHGQLWEAYARWAHLALGLQYEPPVPLCPGRKRRKGLRRRGR
jgi:predicted protein tyrosine phosphatase